MEGRAPVLQGTTQLNIFVIPLASFVHSSIMTRDGRRVDSFRLSAVLFVKVDLFHHPTIYRK
jgi:hypothetical protein